MIESLSGGGAEKVLVTLLNAIDLDKFDVTLCSMVDVGVNKKDLPLGIRYTSILKPANSKIGEFFYRLKYKLVYSLLPLSWVYRLFLPQSNDVEVAFVEGYSTKLISHSTNCRAKKYAWVHTDLINNHWITMVYKSKTEELESYSKFDGIVGVSDVVTQSVKSLYGLQNAVTLYNPIDSDYIMERSAEQYSKPSQSGISLVTTGRLVPQKGYDRLLRVVRRLKADGVDFNLLILGEGPERHKLQKLIEENDLGGAVAMPGFLSNPYAAMKACDLFVCSSVAEGYSTAVTEALILGLPVITTRCSGMSELLGDNEFGVVVDNDEEALYKGLKELLLTPEKLVAYRQKASQRGETFTLSNLMPPIESLLSQ